jgi:hypothetical protein
MISPIVLSECSNGFSIIHLKYYSEIFVDCIFVEGYSILFLKGSYAYFN